MSEAGTSGASAAPAALDRVPAPALFLGAGLSMYYGAALAVGLFALAGAVQVGWARLLVAALVLLVLARPWQLTWTRRTLGIAALFGLFLGAMNLLFYVAIDHLPLGAAVAIEFTGPVAVAVLTAGGGWTWRRLLSPLLAAGGVASISLGEVDWGDLGAGSGLGVLFALGAGAAWAGYMLVGRHIAARAQRAGDVSDSAIDDDAAPTAADTTTTAATAAAAAPTAATTTAADGAAPLAPAPVEPTGSPRPAASPLRTGMASLALGMTTAALAFAVVGAPGVGPLLADTRTIALVIGVAMLSSVVPYALDQVALRRLSTSTFALLNALLPATATLVGFLSLNQLPGAWELGGVAAISLAVALATRR